MTKWELLRQELRMQTRKEIQSRRNRIRRLLRIRRSTIQRYTVATHPRVASALVVSGD